jgi:hypothetical protein
MAEKMKEFTVSRSDLWRIIEGAKAGVACEALGKNHDAPELDVWDGVVYTYVWRTFRKTARDTFLPHCDREACGYLIDLIVSCVEVDPDIDNDEVMLILSKLGVNAG